MNYLLSFHLFVCFAQIRLFSQVEQIITNSKKKNPSRERNFKHSVLGSVSADRLQRMFLDFFMLFAPVEDRGDFCFLVLALLKGNQDNRVLDPQI